jgi:hypothetical protein
MVVSLQLLCHSLYSQGDSEFLPELAGSALVHGPEDRIEVKWSGAASSSKHQGLSGIEQHCDFGEQQNILCD